MEEQRIAIDCTIRGVNEVIKDRASGAKEVISYTVEAKVDLLEKDGERIGVVRTAKMVAMHKDLEVAQRKAIDLAKKEIGYVK